jgi:hypothetical protein
MKTAILSEVVNPAPAHSKCPRRRTSKPFDGRLIRAAGAALTTWGSEGLKDPARLGDKEFAAGGYRGTASPPVRARSRSRAKPGRGEHPDKHGEA